MKILVVLVCSLMSRVQGSLEPAGYKPVPQTGYLPPSFGDHGMENWYLPPSVDPPSRDIPEGPKEPLESLSLPSPRDPVAFSHYLPADRQILHRNHHETVIGPNPTSVFQRTPTLPTDSYLPPNEGQSLSEFHLPDGGYPRSDESSDRVSSRLFGGNEFTPNAKRLEASSMHRSVASEESLSENSQGYQGRHPATSGYRYSPPENQTPAKYEFEYEVKDNYGNDYGHKEVRDGERTQGVYKVLLPDGRKQIVHYEADSHGYRPVVTYEAADGGTTAAGSAANENQGYEY